MLLVGGASCDNLSSLTSTPFSPVATSTYQSSPCSPASSRCTNETFVPSGLHLIVSGARPVTPPSAKICSIVRCFGAVWACPTEKSSEMWMITSKRNFFTNALRFSLRYERTPLNSRNSKVYNLDGVRAQGCGSQGFFENLPGQNRLHFHAHRVLNLVGFDLRLVLKGQSDVIQAVQQTVAREFIHREGCCETLSVFDAQSVEIYGQLVAFDFFRAAHDFRDLHVAQAHCKQAVLQTVVGEDVGK